MLVPNTHLLVEDARVHRATLLRDADRFRLRRMAQPQSRPWMRRVQRRMGGWMIALGTRLSGEQSQQPLPSA